MSDGDQMRASPLRSLIWPLLTLLVVIQAGILALSRVHAAHDSDTLLWTLISVDRLLPFYWSDNRVGTLVPWIASMVHDPYANTQLQVFIWSLSLFACPVLVGALTLRRPSRGVLKLTQHALVYTVLCFLFRFDDQSSIPILFLGHPHGLALCLALCALLVAEKVYRTPSCLFAVFTLAFLTAWVNISLVVFLLTAMFLLTRAHICKTGRLMWQVFSIGVVCMATAVEFALSRQYSGTDLLKGGNLFSMPETLSHLSRNTFAFMLRPASCCTVLLISLSVFFLWKNKGRLLLDYRKLLCLMGASFVLLLAIGCSEWPAKNAYHHRYLAAPAISICILISFVAADALLGWMRAARFSDRNLSVIACVLFVGVLGAEIRTFGLPSFAAARQALESRISADRTSLYESGCTHLVGSYWRVWPRVFDYNAAFPQYHLWGIAYRGEVIRDLWDSWPEAARVYCGLNGDSDVSGSATMFGLPGLLPIATIGNVVRLGPGPNEIVVQRPLTVFRQSLTSSISRLDLRPAQEIWLPIQIENPGPEAWASRGRYPVVISYKWFKNGLMLPIEGDRTALPGPLRPGQTTEADVRVTAPNDPGNFILRVTLVQEMVAWFMFSSNTLLELPVVVQRSTTK
jgi:hypothetical protein